MIQRHPFQLVAVVNSFNRRELLAQALGSLVLALDSAPLAYAIVVFEAGSTDGSREWLSQFAAEHPGLRLDVLPAAAGEQVPFSAGVNRGCQYALETFPQAEFLLLYETDNWLAGAEPLLAAMRLLGREPKLAAAGFTVRLHSGRPCGWGCAFPTVFSFVLGPQLAFRLGIPRPRIRNTVTEGIAWFPADVVYTSPLLIRASVWRELGGMDEQAFPFSDCDLDWEWKLARAGYGCGVLVTDAVVHDNRGAHSGWSSLRVLKFHQARFRLLRKYRGSGVILAIPALFLRHVAELGLLAAMVLVGRRPPAALRKRLVLLRSVWRGYEFI